MSWQKPSRDWRLWRGDNSPLGGRPGRRHFAQHLFKKVMQVYAILHIDIYAIMWYNINVVKGRAVAKVVATPRG